MSVHRLPEPTATVALPSVEAVDQLDAEGLLDFLTQGGALMERARARLALGAARLLGGSAAHETPRPEEPERLFTIPEAAQRLSFAPSYVYALVRQGALAAVRSGRHVRIRPAAIAAFLEAHERGVVDNWHNAVLSHAHDGIGGAATPRTARLETDRTRREGRRASGLGLTVGNRHGRDPGADRTTPATPRHDGEGR